MIFGKFLLNGYLREEHGEPNGGGPAGDPPAQPAQPDLAKLFADMQKSIVTDFDKRVNGINKETKKQIESLTAGLTALRTDIEARFKQPEPTQQEEPQEDEPVEPQQPEPARQQPRKQQAATEPQQQPPPVRRPQKDPHTAALEKKLADLEKAREQDQEQMRRTNDAADKKERSSLLRESISKHKLSDPTMQQDLFDLLLSKVERGEDGNVYGPQSTDLDEWVKVEYDRRPALHPAKPVNGAGAGTGANSPGGGKQLDIDTITADSDPESLRAASIAIANMLKSTGRR